MTTSSTLSAIHTRPAELLQRLIQFDTTNPPGNELACIDYIDGLLRDAGIATQRYAKTPGRPNLLARLPGRGEAPPLLLYGHVDVVTTINQQWQHPPFGGEIHDGFVWGRGALDMKGGVAMMTAAFLRAGIEHLSLPGDVILAIVPDEEAGGEYGARFLVEQHADLFAGVRYAIGEFGGFSMNVSGQKLYPIMVAEKQMCSMRATVRGRGGHGSMPVRGGAMARLSRLLRRLDQNWLPIHVTPPVRAMVEAMAARVGGAKGAVLRQLLNPATAEAVLGLLGPQRSVFEPLLRNTVSPTGLHASDKINVIPSQISVDLDGRLLPGQTPDDMLRELQAAVGPEVALEVLRYEPGPASVNMGLFDALAGVLREADPAGTPVPLVLSGVTDGRFFATLGIQTYGFLPMPLPDDFGFSTSIHAADERVPAAAIEFGANAIFAALGRFTA